ncbi:hypothetical protein C0992_011748, partial [Termitomyces sp. T32_za158]
IPDSYPTNSSDRTASPTIATASNTANLLKSPPAAPKTPQRRHSPAKTVQRPASAVKSKGSPSKTISSLQSKFEGLSFTPSSPTIPPSTSTPDFFVYQYVRDLSGNVNFLHCPMFPSVHHNIQFGMVIDTYLEAHGYDQTSIHAIEQAYILSAGKRAEFVRFLCLEGLPRREAEWIWENIE